MGCYALKRVRFAVSLFVCDKLAHSYLSTVYNLFVENLVIINHVCWLVFFFCMWKLPFFLREKTNCQSFLVLILQTIRLTSDLQHATVKMTLFRNVTWIVLRKTLTVTIKIDWLGKKVVNQKNFLFPITHFCNAKMELLSWEKY